MSLQALITARAEVAAKLQAVLGITAKTDDEDKDLIAQAEAFEKEMEALDRRISLAERIEKATKAAVPVTGAQHQAIDLMTGGVSRGTSVTLAGGDGVVRVQGVRQAWEEPGIGFARFVKCWAASGQNRAEAQALAEQMYPDDKRLVFRAALVQNVGSSGGFLVPEQQSRELVEYLRHMAKVRPVSRVVPINGTMTMPVQTSGVAASYIGEGGDDNAQDLAFGQRRLTARKLRALVAVSNDLIRNSSPEADTIVRDDLAGGLAEAEDLAFIRSTGVGDAPKGLRYWAPTANVNNGSGTTATAIEADLIGMAQRLSAGLKGKLRSPRWFMPSRSFFKLYGLRLANDALVFPEMRDANPRLMGYPVSVTDQIPVNISGSQTEIYLVDTADMILGEEMGITIAVSDVAAYKDGSGTLQSAFSLDQTILRAIAKHDFILRRDEAVQILTGSNVTW